MKRASFLLLILLIVGCSPATPEPTQTPQPTQTPVPTIEPTIEPTINPYCNSEDIIAFNDSFSLLWDKWIDQYKVAISTPQISLADQIVNLQAIKRDLDNIEPTKCTVKYYSLMTKFTGKIIDAFLAFLSNKSKSIYSGLVDEASALENELVTEMNRLAACMPNCKP